MKIRMLFLIVLLAINLLTLFSHAAMSDKDKAAVNVNAFLALNDWDRFKYLSADVGQDDSLNVWFISKEMDHANVTMDVAAIVGVYSGLFKNHPDLSDLNIYVGPKRNEEGMFYCKRSWLSEMESSSDILMELKSAELLAQKVIGTFVDTISTYSFIRDINNAKGIEVIKVHFKNFFRGSDQNFATVDRIWQVSDTDPSRVIINDSDEMIITSGTPLMLEEKYELAIESIDRDGVRVHLELSKSGKVIDSSTVMAPQTAVDNYIYTTDVGSAKDVEVIKVHFKNAFRGADQNFATVDRIWQVSDTDPSRVITNYPNKLAITSGTPLTLGEGYKLAIKSIDINENLVYVELSKNETVVDSAIIMAPNWYKKGTALYDQGEYNGSISAFDKAIEIDPNYEEAWNYKGKVLYELGKYDEAIKAYNKAIDINPEYKWPWCNKGLALAAQGKYNESIDAYNTAIEIDTNYEYAWNCKGKAFAALSKYYLAIVAYNKAIDIDPEYKWPWYNKGAALAAQGKYNESIDAYNTAIEVDPKWEAPWKAKGVVLQRMGRNAEADDAFAKAKELGYA